jgi:hypothetical protein
MPALAGFQEFGTGIAIATYNNRFLKAKGS